MSALGLPADVSVRDALAGFVAYKRALSRKFRTEEAALRLLARFLDAAGITNIAAITAADVDRFLASRRRTRPRSYNHLLGVLRRFFAWLVTQGLLEVIPVTANPRRNTAQRLPYIFTLPQARRLIEAARQLPDRPRGQHRGLIYSTVYALLYGLGLRVGEVA